MEPSWYEGYLDFASVDVSFISLKLILAPLYDCLKQGGIVVALVKPQFEAGRDKVGKNGVDVYKRQVKRRTEQYDQSRKK